MAQQGGWLLSLGKRHFAVGQGIWCWKLFLVKESFDEPGVVFTLENCGGGVGYLGGI